MSDETTEIRELFTRLIPEVAEGIVEIKAIAREKGVRTKVAIVSRDLQVDCVAACVGVRGARIKEIVELLDGERIDVVRWDESLETLIANALQPAEILFVRPDNLQRLAQVYVERSQFPLAVGRRGLNQRLASELIGLELEIVSVERGETE